jgi:acyl-CoA thioester hydrolase
MKVPKPRELTCPVTVEFEDVDSYGIAHHARLVAFLERARVRFLRELGIVIDPRRSPVPVLYDIKMRFVRPALMLDTLQVGIFVASANDYTVDLGYRIRRGLELVARANTTIAFADLESHELVPMPEDCVAAIAKWREDGP